MNLPPPPAGYEARLPRFAEEGRLCGVGLDAYGREARLAVGAAAAWSAMRAEAERAGVKLLLLSGFRSVERQAEIVRKKLAAGQALAEVLRVNAYPGFSEHHTGRAVDIGSADCAHFTEAFESTREFAWLHQYAVRFGFTLSYPRDNLYGITYEPWHWCHSLTPRLLHVDRQGP